MTPTTNWQIFTWILSTGTAFLIVGLFILLGWWTVYKHVLSRTALFKELFARREEVTAARSTHNLGSLMMGRRAAEVHLRKDC